MVSSLTIETDVMINSFFMFITDQLAIFGQLG